MLPVWLTRNLCHYIHSLHAEHCSQHVITRLMLDDLKPEVRTASSLAELSPVGGKVQRLGYLSVYMYVLCSY